MNRPKQIDADSSTTSTEIERKYLLSGMPRLPITAQVWRIEQGYLTEESSSGQPLQANLSSGVLLPGNWGRIRRTMFEDGSIICTHTMKHGSGMIRLETERTISIEQFEQHWPRTAGHRLRKTRYRVREPDAVWEIDVFADDQLVLAEIELNAADATVNFPQWLTPCIVKEVTNDLAYTNASIAARLGGGSQA